MTLEIGGLRKAHGGFELGPVDLAVGREVLSVLGPSGCGKTTLLWTVAGILRQDDGTIRLDGRPLDRLPPEDRNTGLVFQDGALFPNMTVRENIAYASADPGTVAGLAEMLEIEDVLDRRPRTLSGGERQRVALARTLATEPDALLLDEPLSSLDAPIRRRLRDELHDLFGSLAIPVVIVTHDQRTATALGDRIAVLGDGTVEQVGPPSEVIERPENRFVAEFTGNENVFQAEVVGRSKGVVELRVGDVTLTANVEWTSGSAASAEPTRGSIVTACVHPSRLRVRPPSIDEPTSDGNLVGGTVRRWLNEGNEYRVVVGIDGACVDLTATLPPSAFERLAVERGAGLDVAVSPGAIHLIPTAQSGS